MFNDAFVEVKHRGIMDHCPLLLTVPMTLERFSKPFQFFKFMTNLDGFREAVSKAWALGIFGDPICLLCRKLKEAKCELMILNNKQGNAHSNVQQARASL